MRDIQVLSFNQRLSKHDRQRAPQEMFDKIFGTATPGALVPKKDDEK